MQYNTILLYLSSKEKLHLYFNLIVIVLCMTKVLNINFVINLPFHQKTLIYPGSTFDFEHFIHTFIQKKTCTDIAHQKCTLLCTPFMYKCGLAKRITVQGHEGRTSTRKFQPQSCWGERLHSMCHLSLHHLQNN